MTTKNSERNIYDSNPYFRALHYHAKNDIDRLISEKVDVNSRGVNGWTVLHLLASWFDHDEPVSSNDYAHTMLAFFIKHGADVNLPDEQGDTPLHVSADCNNQILPVLLSHSARVNARNHSGKTPLHIAAVSGFSCSQTEPYTRLLVKAGAEIDALDNEGSTPLDLLLRTGDLSQNYLPHAISLNFLQQAGASLSKLGDQAKEKLNIFARKNIDMRSALAEAGILNWQQKINGSSWLHLAVLDMDEKKFNRLFKTFNGSINEQDRQKRTALIHAAGKGNLGIVKTLLAAGASHSSQDEFGNTALHAAAAVDCLEVCKCLIAVGASRECKNRYDETAMDVARENSSRRVIHYFERLDGKPWWKIW